MRGYSLAARKGSIYMLYAALLVGSLWSGGYFPTPKWVLLAMLLAAGAWELVVVIALRQASVLRSPAFWTLAAFAVLATASSAWSVSSADTMRESLLLLGYLSAIFIVLSQLERDRSTLSSASIWLVYTAGFVSAWGIGAYILRISPYTILLDGIYRAGSTFEYSNALSCFVLMALPVTMVMHRRSESEDQPLVALALALETAAALLSFSRSGMLMLALIGIYMLVSSWRHGHLFKIFIALNVGGYIAVAAMVTAESELALAGLMIALALAGACYIGEKYADAIQQKTGLVWSMVLAIFAVNLATSLLIAIPVSTRSIINQRFIKGLTPAKLLPHRMDTYSGTIEAFKAEWVKGWGLGSYAQVYQQYATVKYTKFAHNLILQTAVDTGIVGAALLAVFLVYVLGLSLWRLLRESDSLVRAFAIASLVFVIYNMFDWEWYVPAITAWFMVGLACMEGSE